MMRSGAAALVVAALLAMAGCSDSGDTASACDLITDADAQQILGVPTRPGVEDDEHTGPGTSCDWISEDSTTDPHAAVYGLHISEATDSATRGRFAATRDQQTSPYEVVKVTGLGDEAYFVEYTEPTDNGTPPLPQLHVRTGDSTLTIGTYDSDERPVTSPEAYDIERRAAGIAVAALAG